MSGAPGPWESPPPPRRHRHRVWLWLVAGIGVTIALLAWRFPDALRSGDDKARLLYLVGLLALVSSGVVAARRIGLRRSLVQGLAWVALGLVLVAGYAYRYEFRFVGERVLGALIPSYGATVAAGSVAFRTGDDGHFRVEALVDGVRVRFLVDTGASDVVLSPADARRLGFDLGRLAFTEYFATANGTVRGAPVRLDEIVIGPIRLTNLRASVNEAAMDTSLLGMSFLNRLDSYEVRGDTLTLRR